MPYVHMLPDPSMNYTLNRSRAKRLLLARRCRLFSGGLSYENFLSETSFLIIRTRSNANGTGALLFLFLSAFGFFFSRLLLNWPFATLSSFACGEYSILDRPHTAAVHVERSSGAVHDLLRDHDLLDALQAG
jgi:hypothetical protein